MTFNTICYSSPGFQTNLPLYPQLPRSTFSSARGVLWPTCRGMLSASVQGPYPIWRSSGIALIAAALAMLMGPWDDADCILYPWIPKGIYIPNGEYRVRFRAIELRRWNCGGRGIGECQCILGYRKQCKGVETNDHSNDRCG